VPVNSVEDRLWVLDASVMFGWFAACPTSDAAVAVLEQTQTTQRLAPDLALIELVNAGWKSHRAGAITSDQWHAMAKLTPDLLGEVVGSTSALLQTALRWCERLDHPAYDCLYLALAEQRQATLITADQRLLKVIAAVDGARHLAIGLQTWSGR